MRIGDIVICINVGDSKWLKKGQIYKIFNIDNDYGDWCDVQMINTDYIKPNWYFLSRFKLYTREAKLNRILNEKV